jgi:hypothetical protein
VSSSTTVGAATTAAAARLASWSGNFHVDEFRVLFVSPVEAALLQELDTLILALSNLIAELLPAELIVTSVLSVTSVVVHRLSVHCCSFVVVAWSLYSFISIKSISILLISHTNPTYLDISLKRRKNQRSMKEE